MWKVFGVMNTVIYIFNAPKHSHLILHVHGLLLRLQGRLLLSEVLSAEPISRQRLLNQSRDLALLGILLASDEEPGRVDRMNGSADE